MKKILGVLLSLMLVVSGSFLVMAGCGPQEGPGGESPSPSETTSPSPSAPTQEEINSKALTALVMAGTKLAGGKSQADLQLDAYTVTDGVKDYSLRLDARMQLDLATGADKKSAAWVTGNVQQMYGAAASAVGGGLGLDIRYVNDILYLAMGDFQVSVPAADFDAVIAAISTLLPGDTGTATAAAAAAMAAPLAGELPTEGLFGNCTYTETATDAHATLVLNLSALAGTLPPEVVAMLPATVSLNYVVDKTAAGMAFRSLSVKGLDAAGITLDVSLSFAENADFGEIPVPESVVQGGGGYPDGSPLMQAVANTVAKKSFTLNGAFEIINSDGTLAQRTVYEVVVAPKAGGDADVRVKATYYEGASAEKKSINVSYYTEGWFYVYRFAADGTTPDADAPLRKFAAADVTGDVGNALLYIGGDVLNNSMLQLIGAMLPSIMESMGGAEAPAETPAPTDVFGMISANLRNTDEGCVLTLGLDPTAILPEGVAVAPFTIELSTGKSGEQYYLKSLTVGGEDGISVNALGFLILNVKLTAELDFAASEAVNVLEGLNKEDEFVNMGDETAVKAAIDALPAPDAVTYNKEDPQVTVTLLDNIYETYEWFSALPKGTQARCDGAKIKALNEKYEEMYSVADLAVSAKGLKAAAELTTGDYDTLNSILKNYRDLADETKTVFDTEYPALKQKLDDAKTKMIELYTAEIAEKITDRLNTLFPNYAPTAEDLKTNEPTNAEVFAAKTALNEIRAYYNSLRSGSYSVIETKNMVPEAAVRKLNALLARIPAAEVEDGYAKLNESSDTYGKTLKKLYSDYKRVAEAYLPYIGDATKEGIEVKYAKLLLSEIPVLPKRDTTPAEYAKGIAEFNSAASIAIAQVKALEDAGYTLPTDYAEFYHAMCVIHGVFTLPLSTDSGYAAAYAAVKADYAALTDAAKAILPQWFAEFFAEVVAA